MASVETITQDEILEALASAFTSDAPENAKTAQELAVETGKSVNTVRRSLQMFQRVGRLRAYRVKRLAIDGTNRPTTAYVILPTRKRK